MLAGTNIFGTHCRKLKKTNTQTCRHHPNHESITKTWSKEIWIESSLFPRTEMVSILIPVFYSDASASDRMRRRRRPRLFRQDRHPEAAVHHLTGEVQRLFTGQSRQNPG